MPLTQADIDTRRAAMFTAYAAKRNPAGLLATAQAAANAANAAWTNAVTTYRTLPDTASPSEIAAAETAVTTTELARTQACLQLATVVQQQAGLPAAADNAAMYYSTSVITLGNGA